MHVKSLLAFYQHYQQIAIAENWQHAWLMQGFVTLDSSGFILAKGFCDTLKSAPVFMWCILSVTPAMTFGLCFWGGGEKHKEKSSNNPTQWMILSTALTAQSSEYNPHKHAATCYHPTEKSIAILITSLASPHPKPIFVLLFRATQRGAVIHTISITIPPTSPYSSKHPLKTWADSTVQLHSCSSLSPLSLSPYKDKMHWERAREGAVPVLRGRQGDRRSVENERENEQR